MARHDLLHSDAPWGAAEPRIAIDVLLRPGLRRAYPLPPEGHGDDERFRLLLDALAGHRARPNRRRSRRAPQGTDRSGGAS